MVVSIDGVIQYGNFSVSGSTITFNAALADANTCDFIYHMGTGLLSTPVDNSVSTVKIVDSNIFLLFQSPYFECLIILYFD